MKLDWYIITSTTEFDPLSNSVVLNLTMGHCQIQVALKLCTALQNFHKCLFKPENLCMC